LDELDFDFFTSDKARMLQTGKFDQNVGGYTSLRFSRHNFHDIQRFWELISNSKNNIFAFISIGKDGAKLGAYVRPAVILRASDIFKKESYSD